MNADVESATSDSDRGVDPELAERQRRHIAELEELLAELPGLRRRLLEAEQLVAELPELRDRSRRLEEIEASPALRLIGGARERSRMWARTRLRSLRRELKVALGRVVRRIAGDE